MFVFCHGTSLKNIWPRGDSNLLAGLSQQICYALDHHVSPKGCMMFHDKLLLYI